MWPSSPPTPSKFSIIIAQHLGFQRNNHNKTAIVTDTNDNSNDNDLRDEGKRDRENAMFTDSLVAERNRIIEGELDMALKTMKDENRLQEIYEFIQKYRPGKAVKVHLGLRGSYNAIFRLEYTDGSAILRVMVPGNTAFPDEKVRAEVATMPKIGSLNQDGDSSWTVSSRPLTQVMNDLIVQGGIPPSILPPEHTTFSTSAEYYTALADLHMAHLTFQHNDAIESPNDCRGKFIARHLFRQQARQGKLFFTPLPNSK
jgi:hypothetical protein